MSPQADNVEAASVHQDKNRKRIKRRRATAKERKVFLNRGIKIQKWEVNIMKVQRTSLEEALKIGDYLNKTNEDFARIDIGMGWEKWLIEECKMTYSRAYKYMRLAEAAMKDPEIRKMGLTEAMVSLGLVTRKDFSKAKPDASTESTEAKNDSTDTAAEPVVRPIASYSAIQERDFFVLELDGAKLQDEFLAIAADAQNVAALLHEGSLLIRLKPDDELQDDGDELPDEDLSTDEEEEVASVSA